MERNARLVLGIGTVVLYLLIVVSVLLIIGVVATTGDSPDAPTGMGLVLLLGGFGTTCVALLLSFALNAGYAMHIARNQSFSPNARGGWMVGLFLAGLIAMPVFWFVALKKERPAMEVDRLPEPFTRSMAIVVGIITIVVLVFYGLGMLLMVGSLGGLIAAASANAKDPPMAALASFFAGNVLATIGSLFYAPLSWFYGWVVAANDRLDRKRRGWWAFGIVLIGFVSMPAYWYLVLFKASVPGTPPSLSFEQSKV